MFDTAPPLRQSARNEADSRFQLKSLLNVVVCTGFESYRIVSRTAPLAPSGALPQISVERVFAAIRLRPYVAPNEFATAKAGTGMLSVRCTFAL